MGRWVRVAAASDVPPGSAKAVAIDGRRFALYHDLDGGFFATEDACPHEGTSLSEGLFHQGIVICRSHDWVFDVRSGACRNVPGARLACYATRPAGADVEIELHDDM